MLNNRAVERLFRLSGIWIGILKRCGLQGILRQNGGKFGGAVLSNCSSPKRTSVGKFWSGLLFRGIWFLGGIFGKLEEKALRDVANATQDP